MARITGVLAAALLAAGCAQGPEKAPLEVEIFQTIRQQIALRRAPKPERPPLTRAALDTVEGAHIEVTIEESGVFAYLSQQLVRRDGHPGEIVVWRTEDNVTLAMRDGMLVATRGLGDDILSASVPADGQGLQGPAHGGARSFEIRGLDNGSRRLTLACERRDLGPETIEIVEIRYATRHLQERCEGAGGVIVNDYWADSRSGRIWQSRQWAGPETGYLRIRQLTL
ncbi:YjbF family lipoprotein (plasmid) [Roseobacteraceae bacterium NS-SX3]